MGNPDGDCLFCKINGNVNAIQEIIKGYAWSTAIGLQAVDGLKPSKYLIDTAIQNIEGKITMKEAQGLIDSYYEGRTVKQQNILRRS